MEAADLEWSGTLVPGLLQQYHDRYHVLAPAPLSLALIPSMVWVPMMGGERTHIQKEQNQFRLNSQDFCSSNLGLNPTLNRVMLATEQRRRPSSHLILALDTSSPASPPTNVPTATTWGNIKYRSPTKITGHTQSVQDAATQSQSFKTGIGNCFI